MGKATLRVTQKWIREMDGFNVYVTDSAYYKQHTIPFTSPPYPYKIQRSVSLAAK